MNRSAKLNQRFLLCIAFAGCYGLHAQTSTQNYVVTNEPQVKETNELSVNSLTYDKVKKTIVYFDGLGRPLQSVIWRGSPKGYDIIQGFAYDQFGRENLRYLPYVANQQTGGIVINPMGTSPHKKPADNPSYTVSPQYLFYQNMSDDELVKDQNPFSETIFEPSPLNRPLQDFGPGREWDVNDRAIEHGYLVNINNATSGFHESIKAWKLDGSGLPVTREPVTPYITSDGCYGTGQLMIKSTIDEEGNEVREYTDKSGRVVLKKVQAVEEPSLQNANHWAQTYYIYDDFGNLVMVLPPEATKALLGL